MRAFLAGSFAVSRGFSWLAAVLAVHVLVPTSALRAQELEARAYSPSPVGFNILIVLDTFNTGAIVFDPAGPIDDVTADIHVAALGYVRTLGVAGHSANVGLVLPYVRGDLDGLLLGEPQSVHRSGWGDPRLRFAMNLYGAPALTAKEFASYRQKTIVGASVVVVAPLGQYDPSKLVNIGTNRWAYKPEIGVSRALGKWILEGAVGAWLFTDNTDFYGGRVRSQDPLGSLQLHAIYTIRPRMWVALSGNFYTGGRSSINGAKNLDLQENSRVGVTFALPIDVQRSFKFHYSRGAISTVGADFDSIGVSFQWVWK